MDCSSMWLSSAEPGLARYTAQRELQKAAGRPVLGRRRLLLLLPLLVLSYAGRPRAWWPPGARMC